ncbi:malate dehydrogenase [uncultured Bacteroides sp.]|uniref:malate dehydrogenase n=1 Tax=uncultured Bacteroides sp. TaxID=162156 RepID=UPI002AAA8D14|nr:malate dehydrogenase [uncultured Bacteroides sp.]
MKTLTSEKLTIIGAAGMIGSNMAQTAIMMGLTSEICLYDPFSKGLEGVAEELLQCGFNDVHITYTADIKEALNNCKYLVSSGGAARKEGMTREDLLKGNAEIAIQLGKDIKSYCPDLKHVVVIFNPADITGLLVLLYSGLKPRQVSTLAALDSTRLRNELAKHFNVTSEKVINCRTYGGHGEQMAVFASTTTINNRPLNELIGTPSLSREQWKEIQTKVTQGGKHIIELRGRSSFQSPAYLSIEMIRAVMGGESFQWPAGVYVSNNEYNHIMMAMETTLNKEGVTYKTVSGTTEEHAALNNSYQHLCDLRNELITSGIIPAIEDWKIINPNLG